MKDTYRLVIMTAENQTMNEALQTNTVKREQLPPGTLEITPLGAEKPLNISTLRSDCLEVDLGDGVSLEVRDTLRIKGPGGETNIFCKADS